MDTGKKVMTVLRQIGVDMGAIHPQARLDADLHIDSTEAVELVSAIKRYSGVIIASSWCKCKTVQDLVDYIENHVTIKL